jgi:hypothetical protein
MEIAIPRPILRVEEAKSMTLLILLNAINDVKGGYSGGVSTAI